MEYKEGDWVKHTSGWIGRILSIDEHWVFAMASWRNPILLYKVRRHDVPKKYSVYYCEEIDISPYKFEKSKTTISPLTDWLTPPKKKFRNALKKKQERLALSDVRRGKIRLDGRKS